MMILETNRLCIEEGDLNDSSFIFELLNTPSWLQYIGDQGIHSLKDAEAYISNALIGSYQKNSFGLYKVVLKEEQKPIGLCGLLQREYLSDPDIGFAILPSYTKRGYTFEAAHAVMQYSVESLKLSKLFGITSPKNIASQKLLEKLGMTLQKRGEVGNYEGDTLLYSKKF